jgi:hypothetical protein
MKNSSALVHLWPSSSFLQWQVEWWNELGLAQWVHVVVLDPSVATTTLLPSDHEVHAWLLLSIDIHPALWFRYL